MRGGLRLGPARPDRKTQGCQWNSAWALRVRTLAQCRAPSSSGHSKRTPLVGAECHLPDNIHAAAENVRETEWTSRRLGPFGRRARAVLTSSRPSTRRPRYERKLLLRTQLRHSLQDSQARPISAAYLMIPSACFGSRATSSLDIAKLSAISDAGFPASHFEIEISSNTGLLKRTMNFVGSLPTCST